MKYKVLKNLKHNGVDYSIGSEALLPEDETTLALVKDGVLEAKEEPKVESKKPTKKSTKKVRKPKKARRE